MVTDANKVTTQSVSLFIIVTPFSILIIKMLQIYELFLNPQAFSPKKSNNTANRPPCSKQSGRFLTVTRN
jgi:hypothetical protein